jgi:hypothetical protein
VKKLVLAGLTLTVAFAMAAVAVAQYNAAPVINGTLSVTPTKGGSAKKPKNALLDTRFTVNAESRSTIRRIEYTIPKNIKLNGKGFKRCTSDFINANGDTNCPKGSKVGTGAATAVLSGTGGQLNFDVDIYVEANKTLALYLQTSLFNIAIPGEITNNQVNVDIPERVQRPVSGLYAYVTSVDAFLGKQPGIPAITTIKKKVRKNGKKKTVKVKQPFASLTGCPTGGHTGGVKVFLVPNPSPPPVESLEDQTSSACTK